MVAIYLSDEWFEQIGASKAAPPTASTASTASTEEVLVLQHVVTGGPEGDVCYHVRVANGAVAVVRGQAVTPDVTFAEDYTTAAAIASGTLSAPAALLAGRIRVGGHLARLTNHFDGATIVDPVPAAVRATTTY